MTTGGSVQGRRGTRPGLALVVMVAASLALRPDPAHAQFVPGERDRTETERKSEGCDETVTRPLPVENGIAQVRIASPCRQGQTLTIQSDEIAFDAAFDSAGVLNARIPLFRDPATLRWQGPDGRPREEQARYPAVQRTIRIALIWKGDLSLSLRVNEALTSLPGATCAWFRRGDACRGLGRFDTLAPSSGPGTHVELYTLPLGDAQRGGRLTYRVYFDSQAQAATDPIYCGGGRWAEPTFAVWLLNNRTVKRDPRLSAFRAIPCDGVKREPSYGQSEIVLEP